MTTEQLIQRGKDWFESQNWTPFPFQVQAWEAYLNGRSGLVNAPTGSGKTYSLLLPILLDHLRDPDAGDGLRAVWITPIRALTKEIQSSGERAAAALGLDWEIAIRTGDTKSSARQRMRKKAPQILITTPESMHLLLASNEYEAYFKDLRAVIVDEWHELIGSKRGVQMELALSRLRGFLPEMRTWGISATIGNMEEAVQVLHGPFVPLESLSIIRADIKKLIRIETLMPNTVDRFPWAGHMGLTMIEKVLPIIDRSKTTLVFVNTRAQCELWYQRILEVQPDLAGNLAMHHGSMAREQRDFVEEALHNEQLKAVVCTSSLDLGVDFRPVETIVQIGSPKGVARFVQRAGRSNHRPGETSVIYFVPTHSLELIEAAALREAAERGELEQRIPYLRSFDVLVQYLVTLAVGGGFRPENIFPEVKSTYCYQGITDEEWAWCLDFIVTGGESLDAYNEYRRVGVVDGEYLAVDRRIAMRHRLNIGTIVSDPSLTVKYNRGAKLGTVEERFISQLNNGDTFWFGGRLLELVRVKGMTVTVKRSKKKQGKTPSWNGGRLPLSSPLSNRLRDKMDKLTRHEFTDPELEKVAPLTDLQALRSHLPTKDEFLIEYWHDREGYHLIFYPYEGRHVHEGLSALFAYRISRLVPISFSIAMNDYGFELSSDTEIPIGQAMKEGLFSLKNLEQDLQSGINETEMARRTFRDIASISGLIFKGFPGKEKRDKHIQASSQLFFQVFNDYEPHNLLLQQAYEEVMTFGLQEERMRRALQRINSQKVILSQPHIATPFAFPIIVDRLREKLSSEKLEARIARMKLAIVE